MGAGAGLITAHEVVPNADSKLAALMTLGVGSKKSEVPFAAV